MSEYELLHVLIEIFKIVIDIVKYCEKNTNKKKEKK